MGFMMNDHIIYIPCLKAQVSELPAYRVCEDDGRRSHDSSYQSARSQISVHFVKFMGSPFFLEDGTEILSSLPAARTWVGEPDQSVDDA